MKYVIRKSGSQFIVGHKGWFRQYKTDYVFDNIADLMDFVSFGWHHDFIWECPIPSIQKRDKVLLLGSSSVFTNYRYLSSTAKNENFSTETADMCLVYNEEENMYKVVDKPYDSFEEPFKKTNCLPLWSFEAYDEYIAASERCRRIEDEKIRTDECHFYSFDEYEKWRNENPHIKILKFKDTRGPWSNFACSVIYEYRNIDVQ